MVMLKIYGDDSLVYQGYRCYYCIQSFNQAKDWAMLMVKIYHHCGDGLA